MIHEGRECSELCFRPVPVGLWGFPELEGFYIVWITSVGPSGTSRIPLLLLIDSSHSVFNRPYPIVDDNEYLSTSTRSSLWGAECQCGVAAKFIGADFSFHVSTYNISLKLPKASYVENISSCIIL